MDVKGVQPPLSYVISDSSSRDNLKMSWVSQHSGTTERSVELISITSAFTGQHKIIRTCFDVTCQSI